MSTGFAAASNSPNLAVDSVHNGFYANSGQELNVNGTVNGDTWLAGNIVRVKGTVNGNLYAVGSEVVVEGNITGNAHLAGSKVTVKGTINGSLYAVGSQVTIDRLAKVNGGVVLAGSLVEDSGSVGGQAYVYGAEVNINGPIGGNTTIRSGQITLGDQAAINGGLRYDQNAKISIANDKRITGSVTKLAPAASKTNPLLDRLQGLIFGLLASLLLGLAIISILPGSTVAVANVIWDRPAPSFLAGLGFIIFVPIMFVLLLVIAIGLPLAVVLAMGYVAVLIVSQVFVAVAIGRKVLKNPQFNFGQNINTLLIGLGILSIISLIPVLGAIVGFIVVCFGSGALTLRAYERVLATRAKQLK
ncbi:polymer-forming cytoskeletal protein [Candidatus Saccharibacteria bacterium]|nr:polymer-forming cytoskeletal protein [Candidatus Saccharibacteria bacterium]